MDIEEKVIRVETALIKARDEGKIGRLAFAVNDEPCCSVGHAMVALGWDIGPAGLAPLELLFADDGISETHFSQITNASDSGHFDEARELLLNAMRQEPATP